MSGMGSLVGFSPFLFPESALRGQERKEDRMYRRYFGISALALAGVLVMADSAMAQRRGVYVGPSGVGVYSGHLQIPLEGFAAGLGDHTIVTTLCPVSSKSLSTCRRESL